MLKPTDGEKEVRTYESGGFREALKGRPSFIGFAPFAMTRLAARCAFGRDKYQDARGWQKWLPTMDSMDSCLRHIFAYLRGDNEEDHLAAAMWNLMVIMETEQRAPEYQNIPERKGLKVDAYRPYTPPRKRSR